MRQNVFVVGTRAQLVKLAPVLRIAVESGLRHNVWFTGQHKESIDDLIEDFGLASEFILPEQRKERSSILRLLTWLPGTFLRCRSYIAGVKVWTGHAPLVIVHGDTLSTWLGALAARLGGGHVVHLESGLSSGKLSDPFPEEILRRLTFRLTRFALCPNDEAYERMRALHTPKVVHTGENTILDCVRFAIERGAEVPAGGDYFVASIHRFQNIYQQSALAEIVDELLAISAHGTVNFILHPPTAARLKKYGMYALLDDAANISLRPRMPYTEFLALLAGARAVFSDGGSNQEELAYLGVPTVLYRDRSERPDGLGSNIVLRSEIRASLPEFVTDGGIDALRKPSRLDDPVQPSKITVDELLKWSGPVEKLSK